MRALEQAIEEAIKAFSSKIQIKQILSGTAKEVKETTCTVEREGAPTLLDVRLNAIDDDLQSYVTVYPADGSDVLVAIIEGLKTEAVVIRCSEVQRVKMKIGSETLVFDKDGAKYNGTPVKGWMQKVYSDMQTLKTLLQTSPIAGNGLPAAIAFTPTTTQIQ